jgi:hypothetical protein
VRRFACTIFDEFGRYGENDRYFVEFIGRFASFFVLELILGVPTLCPPFDAYTTPTHHQEISA